MAETMTRKDRVLQLLQTASAEGCVILESLDWPDGPVVKYPTPNGWVPVFVLCRPDTGGSQGDRRLRELRADGVAVESRRHAGKPWMEHRIGAPGRLFR